MNPHRRKPTLELKHLLNQRLHDFGSRKTFKIGEKFEIGGQSTYRSPK